MGSCSEGIWGAAEEGALGMRVALSVLGLVVFLSL